MNEGGRKQLTASKNSTIKHSVNHGGGRRVGFSHLADMTMPNKSRS